MSEIIDELKRKGKSFHNNVPEKDQNYVEFEEEEKQEDGYVPMGGSLKSEHCYYNNAFIRGDEDEDGIPDYINTDEFINGVPPRNHEDEATKLQYQNVEAANDGIKPSEEAKRTSAMSNVIKQMKETLSEGNNSAKAVSSVKKFVDRINKSQSPEKDIDSEDEDPSHDYVNGDENTSWTTGITPNIIVPGHEEGSMAPPIQQKLKKTLRHRGSDPAKTNHERYENTSVQRQRLQSTNVFQSERNSERKTTGVHYRPRKTPETGQESEKETKNKLASSDFMSRIQSRRPQVRLNSDIYEDVPKDSYGIKPTKLEPELNEEASEDEKPPSIDGHNIGPAQLGPSYVNAGNEVKNAEVKSTLDCVKPTKEVKGLNFPNTSLAKNQTEGDSTGVPPPNFTCKRSSQESYVNVPSPVAIPPPSAPGHISATQGKDQPGEESYVNVPSPAAIPPPSAPGHISATQGKDQPGEESYVNVPSPTAIPPPSAPGHVSAQNRPTQSIIIPKKVAKTINRLEAVSSEEYESDDSDDNIYDDDLVVNNLRRTDPARVSQNDEAILGINDRDDGKLPPSLPVKKGSVITKQPAGSGGINPERIETPDEDEENDDDDNVYEDTEEIIRELQGIPPNRTHSNASRKQSTVMKSKGSVNQEEEEEQESFYGDSDGPVLPQEQRAKSGTKEEVKISDNKQDDTYEFIDVPPLNPHKATSSKTKAKTLPSDLNKISDSDMTKSAPKLFNKISMFNKVADKKEKITPKKETIKMTEPTPVVSKDEQKINMANRPPMTLPKPATNFTVSSPDLRTEIEIPKVGSGINTVQRRKVQTIGTELDERLAVLNMQKEWNQ